MTTVAASVLLVLILDQALKLLVLRGLASTTVPLGPVGKLQVVRSRMWWARPGDRPNLAKLWRLWFFAAAIMAVLSMWHPSYGCFVGVLLGGSLSHALETSLRGYVIDYVCLSFWPAFNLADVAITVGALGVLAQMVITTKEVWP